MGRKLLLATQNKGKLEEYRELLAGLPFELVTPGDLGLKMEEGAGGGGSAAEGLEVIDEQAGHEQIVEFCQQYYGSVPNTVLREGEFDWDGCRPLFDDDDLLVGYVHVAEPKTVYLVDQDGGVWPETQGWVPRYGREGVRNCVGVIVALGVLAVLIIAFFSSFK